MKQVNSKVYDKSFFNRVYGEDNNLVDFDSNVSKYYYDEMLRIKKLNKSDTVVDYGCGNGNLAFLLWKKYRCKIIAFDYSKDAIDICKTRLSKIKKKYPKIDITFLVANNNNLPKLDNIKAVYFCDVVEHMYDAEIKMAVEKIRTWSDKTIKIIIHTDNNYYLRFVRPAITTIMILLGKKTISQALVDKEEENRVHINLTNPKKLADTMHKLKVNHLRTLYPKVTLSKIKKQLSVLGHIGLIANICYKILNLTPFLSPSFYSVFRLKGNRHQKITMSGVNLTKKLRNPTKKR